MKKSEFLFTLARIISDAIMIFAGLFLAYHLRIEWFELFKLPSPSPLSLEVFSEMAIKITTILIAVFILNGRYEFRKDERFLKEIIQVFWTYSGGMAIVLVIFFFTKYTFFSRFIFGTAWISGLVFVLMGRMFLRIIRRFFYAKGIGRKKILILGCGAMARDLMITLEKNPGNEVVGFLKDKNEKKEVPEKKIMGDLSDFEKILKQKKITECIMALPRATEKITPEMVRKAHIAGCWFRYMPDELGLDLAAVKTSTIGPHPIITLQNTTLDGWGYVIKNATDFIIASLGLLVLSPFLITIGILVKIESPSAPILYTSKRIGRRGKMFSCLKFRSMIPNAEAQKKELLEKNEREGGVLFKMENDPRVTKLGKFLRKTSIDELPQLLNVLRGEMSLIGPRPHLPEEVEKYQLDQLRVLSIKPGITGFSQIHGRSKLSFEEEMRYEQFYVKNWSIPLDIFIFFKTIWIVLKRKDVA